MKNHARLALAALALAGCRDATAPQGPALALAKSSPPPPSAWVSVASLRTPRYSFGAAAAGRRVYVIGGSGATGAALSSVEVYDAASNAWTAGPALPQARTGLAAVTDANGRIYVIGGRTPPFGDLTPTVLMLDPSGGAWLPVAPLPTPRDNLAAALGADGRIYAIGGARGPVTGTVEAYNPVSNSWSTAASLPTARAVFAAATAGDGRIYAIGGSSGGGPIAAVDAYTYAPGINSWSSVAPLSPARDGLGAASVFGRIYVAGGNPTGTSVDAYSAATNTWSSQPPLGVLRRQGALVAGPDGRLYAIGGVGSAGTAIGSVETFQPTAPVAVAIDIQPGDPLNQIDLGSTGYVRVALLSGPGYDVDKIDGASLRFAGASPLQLRGSATNPGPNAYDERDLKGSDRDLNGDRKHDRVFRFPIGALTLPAGATRACIAGLFEKGAGEFETCAPVQTGGMPRMWSPIASMNDVRYLGRLVADAAGRVYAIGGWNGQTYQPSMERYDPALDRWSQVAPMGLPRSDHAAALGSDGRIYVAGGFDGASVVASAQAYDPSTDSWTSIVPMPSPRDEVASATSTDGRIYVFGGHDGVTVTGAVVAYDPATGAWTSAAAMPAPRFEHVAVRAPSGEIYVIGGLDSFDATVPAATVWAFNPATGTWRTLADLPAPRYSAAAAVDSKGLVYVVGGSDGTTTMNTVFAYDPAANTWTEIASMGSAREGHGAARAADGRIITAGGYDGAGFVRTAEALARP
jgi:N-acetylneuraminic acid mutarotase